MDPQSYAAFGRIRLFLSDLQLVLGGLANVPLYGYGPVPTSRGKPTRRSRAWMEKRRSAPMQTALTTRAAHERFSAQPPPPDKASEGQRQIPSQDGAAISRPRRPNRSLPFHCPALPRPWPNRIRVNTPQAYLTRTSSLRKLVIQRKPYKQHVPQNPAPSRFRYCDQPPSLFDVDEDRERDDCSNRSHSQAESEVEAESDVEVDVGPHNQTLFGFPPILVPTCLTGDDESDRIDETSSDQPDYLSNVDPADHSDYHNDSDCEEDGNFTEPDNQFDRPNSTEYSDYHSPSNHEVIEVHDQPEATNHNDNHDYTTNINESNSCNDFNDDYAESEIYHDNPGEFYEDGGGYDDDGGYDCDDGGDYGAYQEEENYDYYETF